LNLLEIRDLSVDFPAGEDSVKAVSHVSFDIKEGETFGLIGESGSGKSVIGLAILRLLPANAEVSGKALFRGNDIFFLKPSELRKIRGKQIALMPQNPVGSLNPVLKNGLQMGEIFEERGIDKKEGMKKSFALMKKLLLRNPEKLYSFYPHQLSGGMRQRLIACMSLSFEPSLLIADEPTKGLDPEARAEAIDLFNKIKKEHSKTMLLITHDLDLAFEICDRIAVMYAGEMVELGEALKVMKVPMHPYTKGLIRAHPQNGLVPLRGHSPSRIKLPEGCFFHERCEYSAPECHKKHPEMKNNNGAWIRCHFQSLK
jgi:peptide/nickel transport system ATP-binding protein